MTIEFYKYHGTGNDFVAIDNRNLKYTLTQDQVANMCQRRFGIGADGMILIEPSEIADFKMVYYNADGAIGSLCGNGSRCALAFAQFLGITNGNCTFEAADGVHAGNIDGSIYSLEMASFPKISENEMGGFIDTGSPHQLLSVENLNEFNVYNNGKKIRLHPIFKPGGTNVNFTEWKNNVLNVRTFERGVENETYSCGTGVTAAAIYAHYTGATQANEIAIKTKGGNLMVKFTPSEKGYHNIWLIGPAVQTFNGEWEIN